MINLPRLMGIGIVLALLATQAQTAALAHSVRESQTELMKKRMQTLFPIGSAQLACHQEGASTDPQRLARKVHGTLGVRGVRSY